MKHKQYTWYIYNVCIDLSLLFSLFEVDFSAWILSIMIGQILQPPVFLLTSIRFWVASCLTNLHSFTELHYIIRFYPSSHQLITPFPFVQTQIIFIYELYHAFSNPVNHLLLHCTICFRMESKNISRKDLLLYIVTSYNMFSNGIIL